MKTIAFVLSVLLVFLIITIQCVIYVKKIKSSHVRSIIVITDSSNSIVTAKNPQDTIVVRVRKDADGGTVFETKDGMIVEEINQARKGY